MAATQANQIYSIARQSGENQKLQSKCEAVRRDAWLSAERLLEMTQAAATVQWKPNPESEGPRMALRKG